MMSLTRAFVAGMAEIIDMDWIRMFNVNELQVCFAS